MEGAGEANQQPHTTGWSKVQVSGFWPTLAGGGTPGMEAHLAWRHRKLGAEFEV